MLLSSVCLTFPRQLSNSRIVLLSAGKSSRDHSHSLIQLLETKMLINQCASVIICRMLSGNHVGKYVLLYLLLLYFVRKFLWDMYVSDSMRCLLTVHLQHICTHSFHIRTMLTLSWSISSDFCAVHSRNVSQPKIVKNSPKTCFGGSRSSILVPRQSSWAVLVMIRKSVSICNRSHTRGANTDKIAIYYCLPLFDAVVWGHKIWSQHTRDCILCYGKKYLSWAWISSGSWQMDRQTELW